MESVLFHTFTTQGYLHWAELYLESLRYVYGDRINIRMDAVNLEERDINFLKHINSNLDLRNRYVDYADEAKKLGIDKNTFLSWQNEVESGNVTAENYLFKIFISVDQRYRNMKSVIDEAQNDGYKYLVHSDIDVYFRKPLHGLFDILKNSDFAAYFRNRKESTAKILGAFLSFKLHDNINEFMQEWMQNIDSVPFNKRWKGYGQSVLWQTLEEKKNHLSIVDLSYQYEAPVYSQCYSKKAHFWLPSNSIGYHGSTSSFVISWNDYKSGFPRTYVTRSSNNLLKSPSIFEKIYIFIKKAFKIMMNRW